MTAVTVPPPPSEVLLAESNLGDYFRVIWKRRWSVLIIILAILGICLVYCALTPRTYQATTDLLISQPLPQTLLEANNSTTPQVTIDVPTNIQVIESSDVKEIVARTIPNPPSVTATEIGLTDVVKVSCESSNAILAARAANAYADAYLTYERGQTTAELTAASTSLQSRLAQIEDTAASVSNQVQSTPGNSSDAGAESELVQLQGVLQTDEQSLRSQIALYQYYIGTQTGESGSILTAATTPTTPARPKVVEYSIFAGIIGIVLGIAWALGREHTFRS
jgi:polysaccharide biosynthesis transport protein